MKKVKNIYLATKEDREIQDSHYTSGLVLEMEDGSWYSHHTTDPVQSFAEIPTDHTRLTTNPEAAQETTGE